MPEEVLKSFQQDSCSCQELYLNGGHSIVLSKPCLNYTQYNYGDVTWATRKVWNRELVTDDATTKVCSTDTAWLVSLSSSRSFYEVPSEIPV